MMSSAIESETGLDPNIEAIESSDAANPLSIAWLVLSPSKTYETRLRSDDRPPPSPLLRMPLHMLRNAWARKVDRGSCAGTERATKSM